MLVAQARRDGIVQLVVGAVIRDEKGRTLLLRRPSADFYGGLWELPSGKVEPGETLTDAVSREVAEETGLHVTSTGSHLGSFDYVGSSAKPSRQFTFTVAVATTEPVQLSEHDTYGWVPPGSTVAVSDEVAGLLAKL
ncbi:NUDIX hydrolase [Salininema proteolyticum]|uniref:NUDIX hydrolase n=1 Tax=Salininema proteolyticum TaxID=1607685 RepID=A0ABV8U3B2_9ACTN